MKTKIPLSDGDIEVRRSWPRRLIDASFSIGYIPVTWNGNSYSFREICQKKVWDLFWFYSSSVTYCYMKFYNYYIGTLKNQSFVARGHSDLAFSVYFNVIDI